MTSDLPPGVSSSDIPGNTKQDSDWERAIDYCIKSGIESEELIRAVDLWMNNVRPHANSLVTEALEHSYGDSNWDD